MPVLLWVVLLTSGGEAGILQPFYKFDLFSIFGGSSVAGVEQPAKLTRPHDPLDSVAVEAQRRPPGGIQETPRRPSQQSPVHSMTNDLLSMMLSHIIPSSEDNQPAPVPATRPRLPVQTTTPEPPRRPTEAPRRPQEVPRRPQDFAPRPSIIEDDFSFDFDVKPLETPRRPIETTRRPKETTRRPQVPQRRPQEPQRRPVADDFNPRPQTPPRRPVVNEFDFDVVPFEFMREPVTTRATTTTRKPTTTTEQTTPESVDATTDDKDFENENFFDFFPNSMSFFNPPVKMEDSESTTLPPSDNFETTFSSQDLVPLVLEPRPIATTTNIPSTTTTARPTEAAFDQQKLATTLPSVSEETTTFFSFDDDEFSTMNPMKLLLLAMKKLKEMEQSQNSSFKELDNINEVGDEIAEAIPESLSASDNLIMLEPVKKGPVIKVETNPELRDSPQGMKIIDFSSPRYY